MPADRRRLASDQSGPASGRERGRAAWDVVFDRRASEIDPPMARKNYGAEVFASAKRRLKRRELAQFPIPVELWR